VSDRLGPAIVGPDYPLPCLGNDIKKFRYIVQVDADAIRLIVDKELVVADEAAHKDTRVLRESPVGPVVEADALRGLEWPDAVLVFEDAGLADLLRVPLPDVEIGLVVYFFKIEALPVEDLGKEGVVLPAHFLDNRVRRRVLDESYVCRVILFAGVEGDPYLGPSPADRRDQDLPGLVADALGLFNPADRYALQGLDLHDIVMQALEDEFRPVDALDAVERRSEQLRQPQHGDPVKQQAVNGVRNR